MFIVYFCRIFVYKRIYMTDKQVILDYKEHERLLECENALKENSIYIEWYSLDGYSRFTKTHSIKTVGNIPEEITKVISLNTELLNQINNDIKVRNSVNTNTSEYLLKLRENFWKRVKFLIHPWDFIQ